MNKPELIQAYKEEFEAIYGPNRLSVKDNYRDGEHVGWVVQVDKGEPKLMYPSDIKEAIQMFKQ